jgi:hypothetical protein
MENAGVFCGHLEYFTVIWYILWPFGSVVIIRYIFRHFGILCQEKSGNPATYVPMFICGSNKKIIAFILVAGMLPEISARKTRLVTKKLANRNFFKSLNIIPTI